MCKIHSCLKRYYIEQRALASEVWPIIHTPVIASLMVTTWNINIALLATLINLDGQRATVIAGKPQVDVSYFPLC